MQIKQNTLFTALAGLALVCPTLTLFAQADPIERCRQADSDQQRIACLEQALRGTEAELEPAAPKTSREPPLETTEPAASRIADMGAEQVSARSSRARSDEPALRLQAAVHNVEVIPYQRLQITLDNGHVWRQIRGDTQRIQARRASEQTVEIWESNLGGYRMRLNEMARTIRVERIR